MVEVDFNIASLEENLLADLAKIIELEFSDTLQGVFVFSMEPLDLIFVYQKDSKIDAFRLRQVLYHLEVKYAYRIFINNKLLSYEEFVGGGINEGLKDRMVWGKELGS